MLTRHVRARIESLFAPAFGDLAALAERIRGRVTAAFSSVGERRRFWERLFTGPVAEKVFAGRGEEAEIEALRALEIEPNWTPGHVSLVGALHACGRQNEAPTLPFGMIADYAGPSYFLATGVLAALILKKSAACNKFWPMLLRRFRNFRHNSGRH